MLNDCSSFPHAGPMPVDVEKHPLPWIAKHHSQVQTGGTWRPDCQPRQKVAILVPFRDRDDDLLLLLNNIHPFMQAQLLEYTVYIVEQVLSPQVKCSLYIHACMHTYMYGAISRYHESRHQSVVCVRLCVFGYEIKQVDP